MNETSSRDTVLILGAVWVEPHSSAAGTRMIQLIHYFLSEGYKVVFGCAATKGDRPLNLESMGVQETQVEINDDSFNLLVKDLMPDIVVFDRFMTEEQFGWRVREVTPEALLILDTEDLHSLRRVRHECVKKGLSFSPELLLTSDVAKREIAAILRCDLSLMISSYEMKLLKEVFRVDSSLLLHLPFMFDSLTESHVASWLPYEERHHIIFIGNGLHAPNVDAILELRKNLWGEIRKLLPRVELHIYGAYMTQQIRQLHKPSEGFFIKGVASNAMDVVSQARLVLAPLRFGAGIKGKLTEAMICGTPSVTTSIGVEGMYDGKAWSGAVTKSNENFISQTVELYQNRERWGEAQKNGTEIINSFYNIEKLIPRLREKITTLRRSLNTHRQANFLGGMLQHQSLYASKYMGLWITEKNRRHE